MGWAQVYIERLREGHAVKFRPRGNSMAGLIESGQLVTVEPADMANVTSGDVVLCKVNGREYLHLVKAVAGSRALIGNNRGRTNGWTSNVFGKVTKIED